MQSKILKQLVSDRSAHQPVVLATDLESGDQFLLYPRGRSVPSESIPGEIIEAARIAQKLDRGTTVEHQERRWFLNVFNPPLRMIIVGAVHITQALAPMAAMAGFLVSVIDPRRAFATTERFPNVSLHSEWPDEVLAKSPPDGRTAVITVTHDPKLDDPALIAALQSDAFFIGALGSKKTHAARLDRLRHEGFTEPQLGRIRGPLGLPIGAKSPAEIAVSALADVIQVLRLG